MIARYVRVSTANQKLERQLIKDFPNERLFIDVISGSVPFSKREKGADLLRAVEENTVSSVCVKSIDRLGRNLVDILHTIELFHQNNVSLKVANLGLESLIDGKENQAFKLIVSVMGTIAEMERTTMLERQREGIELAKIKGHYKGRVRGSKESEQKVLEKYKHVVKELKYGTSLRKTARLCNVSLSTVQKVKKII